MPMMGYMQKQIEELGQLSQQTTVRSDLPFQKTESPLCLLKAE
jgi:hypothetical protein